MPMRPGLWGWSAGPPQRNGASQENSRLLSRSLVGRDLWQGLQPDTLGWAVTALSQRAGFDAQIEKCGHRDRDIKALTLPFQARR